MSLIHQCHRVSSSMLRVTIQALENAHHKEHVKLTESNTEHMSLEEWCTVQQETHPMFKFWFLVSGSSPYACLCDLSGLPTSHCISSHWRSLYTFFHFWPLPLCTSDIISPPRYDDSVSFASPYICRIPEWTLHSQEDESCVIKPGNRSSTWPP